VIDIDIVIYLFIYLFKHLLHKMKKKDN